MSGTVLGARVKLQIIQRLSLRGLSRLPGPSPLTGLDSATSSHTISRCVQRRALSLSPNLLLPQPQQGHLQLEGPLDHGPENPGAPSRPLAALPQSFAQAWPPLRGVRGLSASPSHEPRLCLWFIFSHLSLETRGLLPSLPSIHASCSSGGDPTGVTSSLVILLFKSCPWLFMALGIKSAPWPDI